MSMLHVAFKSPHTLVLSFILTSLTPTHLITQVLLVTREESQLELGLSKMGQYWTDPVAAPRWPSLGTGQGCSWPQEPLEPGPECDQGSSSSYQSYPLGIDSLLLFFILSLQPLKTNGVYPSPEQISKEGDSEAQPGLDGRKQERPWQVPPQLPG